MQALSSVQPHTRQLLTSKIVSGIFHLLGLASMSCGHRELLVLGQGLVRVKLKGHLVELANLELAGRLFRDYKHLAVGRWSSAAERLGLGAGHLDLESATLFVVLQFRLLRDPETT